MPKRRCSFKKCDRTPEPNAKAALCRGHRAQKDRGERLRKLRAWRKR